MTRRTQPTFIRFLLPLALTAGIALSGIQQDAFSAAKAAHKKHPAPTAQTKAPAQSVSENYSTVVPTDLLKDPKGYMNKKVKFEAVFNSFSSLGLDYKKAMRDSKDYVSFLIKRPDVPGRMIPLAELKLIYPRKKSEEVIHLETGDKISVKGQVFSTALNEPWVDVTEVKIIQKQKADKEEPCHDNC